MSRQAIKNHLRNLKLIGRSEACHRESNYEQRQNYRLHQHKWMLPATQYKIVKMLHKIPTWPRVRELVARSSAYVRQIVDNAWATFWPEYAVLCDRATF